MSQYAKQGGVFGMGVVAAFVVVLGLFAFYPQEGTAFFGFRTSHGDLDAKLDALEAKIDALQFNTHIPYPTTCVQTTNPT